MPTFLENLIAALSTAQPRPQPKRISNAGPRPATRVMQPAKVHSRPAPRIPSASHSTPLRAPDVNALVIFSTTVKTLSGFAPLTDAAFARAVGGLPKHVEGVTMLGAGMNQAIDLFNAAPPGMNRRITVLTDGHANDRPAALAAAQRAAQARINIDTIGIGKPGDYDADLLRAISAATYRGRTYHCGNVASLDRAFGQGRSRSISHVGQANVYVVDVSGSMASDFGRQSRIEAVRDAIERLVRVKQKLYN